MSNPKILAVSGKAFADNLNGQMEVIDETQKQLLNIFKSMDSIAENQKKHGALIEELAKLLGVPVLDLSEVEQ